jgi:hypothetical protein
MPFFIDLKTEPFPLERAALSLNRLLSTGTAIFHLY